MVYKQGETNQITSTLDEEQAMSSHATLNSTGWIFMKSHYDSPVTKDKLHKNQSMRSAYISVTQGRILVNNHSFYSSISPQPSFTKNSVPTYTLFTLSTDSSPKPFFHLLHRNASLLNELEELTG